MEYIALPLEHYDGGDFMPKNTQRESKPLSGKQEELKNAVDSVAGNHHNPNQEHNAKKEALGPNTKR